MDIYEPKITHLKALVELIKQNSLSELEELLNIPAIERVLECFKDVDRQPELPKELYDAFTNFLDTYIKIFNNYWQMLKCKDFSGFSNKILLPPGHKRKLAKDLKVSPVTVWKALTGQTKSQLARTIRKAALESGGVYAIRE